MEQRQKNKEFEIKVNGDSAIILRCFSYGESAVIPREIDGYRVTEIAPYAFSAHMDHPPEEETGQDALCGERLEEIVLPDTIEKIVEEMMTTTKSERTTRVIDFDQDASMEQKKREGYF